MKYIDTERQLADIFNKPLDATHFASLPGGVLVFAIPMPLFKEELVFCLVYTLSYILLLFCCISSYLSIASPVILACIWLMMLIIMLG
jgi:hypothetical protein